MTDRDDRKKRVCVTLTERDHDRLARETGRTPPGYLRYLLHTHFRERDGPPPEDSLTGRRP